MHLFLPKEVLGSWREKPCLPYVFSMSSACVPKFFPCLAHVLHHLPCFPHALGGSPCPSNVVYRCGRAYIPSGAQSSSIGKLNLSLRLKKKKCKLIKKYSVQTLSWSWLLLGGLICAGHKSIWVGLIAHSQ